VNPTALGNDSLIYTEVNREVHGNNLETQALFGKLVKEINKKIGSGLEYEKILDHIFESLSLLIPYDRMGIALIDSRSETVTLKWVRSTVPVQSLRRNYSAPLKKSSLDHIFRTGRPRIINDLTAYLNAHPESESTKLILKDGVRSNLTCPLFAQNKPIGIVFFSSSKENTFDQDHVEIFMSIAQELAVVVEHGILLDFFSTNNMRIQNLRTVLHDLRAPLSIMQSYLDYCASEEWYQSLSQTAQKVFSVLNRNVHYMFQLIEDLSTYTQLDSQPLKLETVNLKNFLENIIDTGTTLAASKEILIQNEISNIPDEAQLDINKVARVLINLFTNAIKFSNRKSQILLSVHAKNNQLHFSVTDQGSGIKQSELPLLFKEFGRTSTLPTEGEKSTGLGLAIAKRIVEQLGGQISVQSEVNKGSTFSFWVPIQIRP
jgi:hypothetical protein